jgi:CHAT domain-containing protein
VHFSCHGRYNWGDPPASGLELADGRLTLADLQVGDVDLSMARLVTLSACETGIVDIFQGSSEEYVGVPAGFLLSGVPTVLSSLWAVPDLSTALLMAHFYEQHLHLEQDIATALQQAQRWVRELPVAAVAEYAAGFYEQAPEASKAALWRLIRSYRYQARQNPLQQPFAHPYYWAAFTVNGL